MKITPIYFTPFKTNGDNMFGYTPKSEWEKYYTAGENNLTNWALRSLVIDDGQHVVLIDTGFSNINSSILDEYYISDYKTLENKLSEVGHKTSDITDVLFTHLHVDHCGGGFNKIENSITSSLSHSRFVVSQQQLKSASKPSNFEKDSFQPEIIEAILQLLNNEIIAKSCFFMPWLELRIFNGHTLSLIIPIIHTPKNSIAFVGDLIPSIAHIKLNSVMNYNIDPALSLDEQNTFLEEACNKNYILFFQHDFYNECCTLKKENSRVVPADVFKLSDVI